MITKMGLLFVFDRVTGAPMFGMEERAARIGGSLTISSAPDTGTTVQVDVPLPTQANQS